MKRITLKLPDGSLKYSACEEELARRLCYYEDIHEKLLGRSAFAKQQLRELELRDKAMSPQYKELLGQIMIDDSVLKVLDGKE